MMRHTPDSQPLTPQTTPSHLETKAGKGQSGLSQRANQLPPNSFSSHFSNPSPSQVNPSWGFPHPHRNQSISSFPASAQSSLPSIAHVFRIEETERSSPQYETECLNGRKFEVMAERSVSSDEPDVDCRPPDCVIPDCTTPDCTIPDPVNGGMHRITTDHLAESLGQTLGQDNGNSNGNGSNGESISPNAELNHEFEGEEPERGLLPVLRNLNFLKLWTGQVFSQLADKVYLVLMIALIANRFQSQDQSISGWVSSLMIAFTIPAILFGSVAGVFVDHWRKRAVLVATNLLRGGLVLSLPLLLWFSEGVQPLAGLPSGFFVLLVVTFLVSTLTQFFAPAEQAAIPLLVERKHLLSANSLYTMTMMASVIVGFALGEPLLELADRLLVPIALQLHAGADFGKELLVGGSYAIAGLVLMLLKTKETAPSDADESLPDVWANIRDGLRYLKQQAQVRSAMLQLVILFSIFAALAVLAVRMAEVMPEIKSSQFGFLLAAGGVGMAIGAVGVGQFGQRLSRAQLSLYGSIGMALSLGAISFVTQRFFPTLPLLVMLGACAAITGVPMQTAIQEETPEEMRGKVFGLQNNAINIALSLPLALAGLAETVFGLQAVFVGLAVLALLGGILTWSISRRQFNQNVP